jgi:mRNA interferase MazF
MVIQQGDIYWVEYGYGSARPYVVIQNDRVNRGAINSVITCELTSNLKSANYPGNVLLYPGEANMPKSSVVNVSQVHTINKDLLGDLIGTLPLPRVRQILAGLWLLLEPESTNSVTP